MKFSLTVIIVILLTSCSSDLLQKPKHKAPVGAFLNQFNLGFTGYAWEFKSREGGTVWLPSTSLLLDAHVDKRIEKVNYDNFHKLRKTIDESKFFVMWVGKYWKPSYFNIKEIQRAMEYGKIPVFIYWYFGDDFATDDPQNVIAQEQEKYHSMNQTFINFINQLHGEVMVLLEPEFNKQNILKNPISKELFISTMHNSLDFLRENISQNVHLYLGLSMNDNGSKYRYESETECGYEHCALGDKHTWKKTIEILQNFKDKTDIVAFSMMLSPLTRDLNNPNIPHAYHDEKLGIGYIPKRIGNLAQELYNQLGKPVFLSHLVMASGRWRDVNQNQKIENSEIDANGWNKVIYDTFSAFDYQYFQQKGLFGLALMNLFDDPKHDLGGYNYFLHNEHHLGLLYSDVDPESKEANDGNLHFKMYQKTPLIDLLFKKRLP